LRQIEQDVTVASTRQQGAAARVVTAFWQSERGRRGEDSATFESYTRIPG
jgi:hypothetical protein